MSNSSIAGKAGKPAVSEWESEGGSLRPGAADPLPEGITAETVVRYRVGPYCYSRLEDALAEHSRRS